MAHDSTGIDLREYRNAIALEVFVGDFCRAPVRTHGRKLAHNQAFNVRLRGLGIGWRGAVVSDVRVREHHNLARVTRVSEDFLVAGEGCVENNFADAFCDCAVSLAAKETPVFEGENCLHYLSLGEWIL